MVWSESAQLPLPLGEGRGEGTSLPFSPWERAGVRALRRPIPRDVRRATGAAGQLALALDFPAERQLLLADLSLALVVRVDGEAHHGRPPRLEPGLVAALHAA